MYPPHTPTPPLDPEYFTVSPSGVLHVRKGEAAELTTLAAWTRERTLFTFLRRIPFFKNYILIRCFTRWHLVSSLQSLEFLPSCAVPGRHPVPVASHWPTMSALIRVGSVTGPFHPAFDGFGNHLFMMAVQHEAD